MDLIFYALIVSIVALVFAGFLTRWIKKHSRGSDKMIEISDAVHHGAMTFLHKEYKVLIVFVIVVASILYFAINQKTAIAFVVGAFFSALSGNIGMRIATASNSRTAEGVKENIGKGLKIAFSSGTVMGLCVTGLGLFGVTALYLIFGEPNIIYGFGFGASSIALFARVGGGIYTKASDVGADIVGKVEKGIPEDDPRNPAVIADNVGDNVGDVAGMGADLFESYVDSIIVVMVLGLAFTAIADTMVILPLVIASIGIISSIIGYFFVNGANNSNLRGVMDRGIFIAAILMAILSFFAIKLLTNNLNIFYATVAGLVAGVIIGLITEYYTSEKNKPVQSISEASKTGAATNIIAGLSVGMLSTLVPVLVVSIAILVSYYFFGLYGIAIAAVGMLSTLAITLAADTYGPVADNAAGIAEMAKMGKTVRERAETLDAVGNTTAAIGKGFAIGSAALTALALFVGYTQAVKLDSINALNPTIIVGMFIGGLLPFLFSALTMRAVGKTASHVINEVRRQFKQIKGLMEGKAKPDYKRCVGISTQAALKQMVIPSLLAIMVPLLVGFLLGTEALGGLLVGSIVTGFLMAVFMANAGGAWDNAKKYIEAGHFGGKGSEAHKAAVVGDTVGDPMKDTSGPSLNILIKLMSIVALIFAPLIIKFGGIFVVG